MLGRSGREKSMIRERVADNVYVFTSELYAQVNSGAVVGPDWSVLIDTLAYPEETAEINDFVEVRLNSPVRYIINTHYHADHVLGNSAFPGATILGHRLSRDLMGTRARAALQAASEQNRALHDVDLVLPGIVMDSGTMSLRVGRRTLEMLALPGHSPDGVGVLVNEDRVLFSGDAVMPIPYFVDGDLEDMLTSLKRIPRLKLENLVQGHGEVILRGEVQNAIRSNVNYLTTLKRHVSRAARRKDPEAALREITIEECGKARILLGGVAGELHWRNLVALWKQGVRDD
jgi:cyclase